MREEDRDLVRSYSRLKRFQRRLYRLTGEGAIPKPGGVTYRAIAYVMALTPVMLLVFFLTPGRPRLWFVWAVMVAAGLGNVLLKAQPDGRPGHKFVFSWTMVMMERLLDWFQPRRFVHGFALRCRWDAFTPGLRRARVRGPARVTFNVPVDTTTSGMHPHVRPGVEA